MKGKEGPGVRGLECGEGVRGCIGGTKEKSPAIVYSVFEVTGYARTGDGAFGRDSGCIGLQF
jgi:hypothetical protein